MVLLLLEVACLENSFNLMDKIQAELNEDEQTPTDTELKSIIENECKATNVYRLCISPAESENSSGETTPDAGMLNKAPFDVKLAPSLLDKEKTIFNEDSKSELDQPFLTPEKTVRPINFKNLSPRSVIYHFSSRYPSGVLRPSKVRRNSFQTLLEFTSTDSNVASSSEAGLEPLKRTRAKSDDLSDKTDLYENVCNTQPKKKKHGLGSTGEKMENESHVASVSAELRELTVFSKEKHK